MLACQTMRQHFFSYMKVIPPLSANVRFCFFPLSLMSSFLLLFILFAIWLVSCLGGQGAHGVADGLVVWVDAGQVLQDALEELWVLHHIVVIFLLFGYNRGHD